MFNIEKLKSRERFYCIINSSCNNKPTSQIYFEKKFDSKELDSRVIYTLPRKLTANTYLRSLQYKILNNILYLNEKLFVFGLSPTSSCSFCSSFGENIAHLFCDCTIMQCHWKKLQLKLKDNIAFLSLTAQATTIFGIFAADWRSYLIQNRILLLSKLYIYKSRKKFVGSNCLLKEISKIKKIEEKVASVNEKKHCM